MNTQTYAPRGRGAVIMVLLVVPVVVGVRHEQGSGRTFNRSHTNTDGARQAGVATVRRAVAKWLDFGGTNSG
jgi:hypothetical protein